jgi:hypothetical protein
MSSESSFTFGLETPEASELSALIPEIDAALGFWAPFLFEDINGDDVYNDGEIITGFTNTWLVYTTQDIPDFYVTEGWNALEMTFTEEPATPVALDNIPLSGNFTPVESITIGGSYDTALGNRRIAFIAADTSDENDFPLTMSDIAATDPWTATFSETPSEEYYMESEEDSPTVVASAMVYTDVNGNGSFDMTDIYASVLSVCYTGLTTPKPIAAVYTFPVTDFTTAMYANLYGLNIGWSIAVDNNSEPMILSDEELNNLVIDENCVFE